MNPSQTPISLITSTNASLHRCSSRRHLSSSHMANPRRCSPALAQRYCARCKSVYAAFQIWSVEKKRGWNSMVLSLRSLFFSNINPFFIEKRIHILCACVHVCIPELRYFFIHDCKYMSCIAFIG